MSLSKRDRNSIKRLEALHKASDALKDFRPNIGEPDEEAKLVSLGRAYKMGADCASMLYAGMNFIGASPESPFDKSCPAHRMFVAGFLDVLATKTIIVANDSNCIEYIGNRGELVNSHKVKGFVMTDQDGKDK